MGLFDFLKNKNHEIHKTRKTKPYDPSKKKCCARCGIDTALLKKSQYAQLEPGVYYCDVCQAALKAEPKKPSKEKPQPVSRPKPAPKKPVQMQSAPTVQPAAQNVPQITDDGETIMIDFGSQCSTSGNLLSADLKFQYKNGLAWFDWVVSWHAGYHNDGAGGTEYIPQEVLGHWSFDDALTFFTFRRPEFNAIEEGRRAALAHPRIGEFFPGTAAFPAAQPTECGWSICLARLESGDSMTLITEGKKPDLPIHMMIPRLEITQNGAMESRSLEGKNDQLTLRQLLAWLAREYPAFAEALSDPNLTLSPLLQACFSEDWYADLIEPTEQLEGLRALRIQYRSYTDRCTLMHHISSQTGTRPDGTPIVWVSYRPSPLSGEDFTDQTLEEFRRKLLLHFPDAASRFCDDDRVDTLFAQSRQDDGITEVRSHPGDMHIIKLSWTEESGQDFKVRLETNAYGTSGTLVLLRGFSEKDGHGIPTNLSSWKSLQAYAGGVLSNPFALRRLWRFVRDVVESRSAAGLTVNWGNGYAASLQYRDLSWLILWGQNGNFDHCLPLPKEIRKTKADFADYLVQNIGHGSVRHNFFPLYSYCK